MLKSGSRSREPRRPARQPGRLRSPTASPPIVARGGAFTQFGKGATTVVLPFLAWGYGNETWRVFRQTSFTYFRWQAFLWGFAGFIVFWALFRKRLEFVRTMEHEFTHLLVGLLFLKRPVSFHASEKDGGLVQMGGMNFMIRLAPYFLPTVSLALMLLGAVVQRGYVWWLLVAFGAATAYHICSDAMEIRSYQFDLRQSGLWFCWLFLPVANLFCYGLIAAYVAAGDTGVWHFVVDGGTRIVKLFVAK
jgi:hypothetical protein